MKKVTLLCLILLASFNFGLTQGTLRGKITDDNGETLIGVTVVLKANTSIGTITDFDGNYSLKIPLAGPQVLMISYVGFTKVEENVSLKNNEIVIKNLSLSPSTTSLIEVEVVAKQSKDRGYYMESIKKKAASTIDFVSSAAMKLSGDNNVAAAIGRVPGVSTNGSFITVRGIGDRYIKTTINGAQIPTLDPFTNNIKLDLIPASLIDNIVITKTASPDLPGSWTGAYISVETKDYPETFSLNVETQIGYNEQTSFKQILANQTSSTDWLGFDNSFRDHNHSIFVNANINPSQYEELVALGLKDFYKSLGVISKWQDGSIAGENYYKLGLVELGILGKAQFNDPKAVEVAKNLFLKDGFRDKAYEIINADAGKTGRSFPNNWNTFLKKAPLNLSQSFGMGNQAKLFGREIGFVFGYRYNSSILFDPNAITSRVTQIRYDSLGNPLVNSVLNQEYVKYINGWSALLNIAYKYSPNHSLSLLFMPNFIGVNSLRDAEDFHGSTTYLYTFTKDQFYEQRKQLVYQLKSEHYFPETKLKMEINASYTNGNSNAPDFKSLKYFANNDSFYLFDKTLSSINRDFRYLSENILDSKINFELPIGDKPGMPRKIKFGAAYQNVDKNFAQYDYLLRFNTGTSNRVVGKDFDKYFSLDKFDVKVSDYSGYNSIDLFYRSNSGPSSQSIGHSNIEAAYLLTDYTIFPSLRFLGGLRVEHFDLLTDIASYHDLGYERNDPRRKGSGDAFLVNPAKFNKVDYMPSLNLIYKLKNDELTPVNLRLNFSKSIARPSIREYSEIIVRDFELDADVFGNADLKEVEINNYDLRLESFFPTGDNFTFSLFYKDFKNHIELIGTGDTYTWTNAESSRVVGLEFEARKKICKGLEFRTNISLVDSRTKIIERALSIFDGVRVWFPVDTITRRMFGQAPYVLNGILSYSFESIGLVTTASYNYQGPRLILSSSNGDTPDVYEMPRHLLDFKASKSIAKYFNISFTIKDILNAPIRRSFKYKEGYILDFSRYSYGTTYSLGISYKI